MDEGVHCRTRLRMCGFDLSDSGKDGCQRHAIQLASEVIFGREVLEHRCRADARFNGNGARADRFVALSSDEVEGGFQNLLAYKWPTAHVRFPAVMIGSMCFLLTMQACAFLCEVSRGELG